jgi:hypothetical protein
LVLSIASLIYIFFTRKTATTVCNFERLLLTVYYEKLQYIGSQYFDFIKLFFIFNIDLNGVSDE